ncbi:hypothetical protein ACN2XU_04590 [Primorskyibacter sp. 2E107]|uniref:hypothetical protein n=1 Tax=Primorskyibacter sp. 2E107 TaxID=3403458 RepID=UPI003AF438A6
MTLSLALAGCAAMADGKPDLAKITGHYVGPGVTCPQFQLDTGETISLSGVQETALQPGTPVVLEGLWQRMSTCMQGRDFRVVDILTPE